MSVKISELPILDSLADNDIVAGVDVSGNVTSKIEMGTLKNYIDTNTQYTAGTNIDITDNVISAPDVYNKDEMDNQIEELQNEVDSLSTIFNAFPTESGEGESLTLDDTAEVKFKKFDLKGNTSQNTYTGKNLFGVSDTTGSASGVTLTVTNGEILVTGTSSNSGQIDIPIEDISLSTTQAYSVKLIDSGTATGSYGRYFLDSSSSLIGWSYGQSGLSDNTNFNPNSNTTAKYFRIYWNSGASFSNFKFKIMFEKGSTSSSYEPYTGGNPSPSPEYPQDVHVVSGDNEINVCGKNLFTLKNISNSTTLGIEKTINNSELKLNGTSSGAGNIIGRQTTGITLGAGTYSILVQRKSGTVISNSKQSAFYFRKPKGTEIIAFNYNNFSNSDYSFKNSFVLSEPTELYVEIYCNGSGYVFTDLELQFQIEKGYNASPVYEPYQGNTYNIDLPVENLIPYQNQDFTINNVRYYCSNGNLYLNGTSTGETSRTNQSFKDNFAFYLEAGTYIFKQNILDSGTANYFGKTIAKYDDNTSLAYINNTSSQATFTLTERTRVYLGFYIYQKTFTNETFNIQLEVGSKANSYTPYGTTPIELCKIGTYHDYFYKDSGKWYLHKEIGKYTFTGNETGVLQNSGKRFDITCLDNNMPICINNSTPSEVSQIYCNILLASSGASTWGGNQGISYNTGTNGQILVSISGATTTQAYLSALKDNYCYYILATPTNTEVEYQPLIDQLNELEKAMSKDGQTNISQVNNDLGFIIYAEAIKSLENVLDRIELLES